MKKILMDTNFLMIPYQFKVDIFDEIDRICSFKHQLYVIDKTIKELKKLAESRGKKGACARLALDFIKVFKVNIINTSKYEETHPDDIIVKLADQDYIVATQDIKLKQQLRRKKISLIILRQKKYLKLLE